MSSVVKYRKDAVIYFKGERSDSVYFVKDGTVVLVTGESSDLDRKKQNSKQMSKGEFFGLFSSLGKFPRQETAISLTDVELIIFNEPDLEELINKRKSFALQLMRMLSKDLRIIHRKTQALLKNEVQTSIEEGLYNYIEMYVKNEESKKAKYVIAKFLEAYPNSEKVASLKELEKKL